LGKFVNHSSRYPNCKPSPVKFRGNTKICLFALRDIEEGEELRYNYGVTFPEWKVGNFFTY